MLIKTNETLNYIQVDENGEFLVACTSDNDLIAVFTFTVIHDRLSCEIQFGEVEYCYKQAERLWQLLAEIE